MKKSLIFITFLFSLFFTIITSCSNTTGNDDYTYTINKQEKSLILKLISEDNSILLNSSSRTILPEYYNPEDLIYYVCYKDLQDSNNTWQIKSHVPFTLKDSYSGTLVCTFNLSYYEFQLYALTAENSLDLETHYTLDKYNLSSLASFTAYSYADLRFDEVIYFNLQPNQTSYGYGNVNITVNHLNSWKTPAYCKVLMGIYDINTGSSITSEESIFSSSTNRNTIINYTYSNNTVPAGRYNFKVKYIVYDPTSYSPVLGSYEFDKYQTYEYGDIIVVNKNQTSNATIDIPYFFDEPPEAPSCLIAGYKDPENKGDGYFKVQLAWFDNSFTETSFKLQFLCASNSDYYTTPTNDSEWNNIQSHNGGSVYKNLLSSYLSEFSYASTSSSNITSAEFYLPLGNRYYVRICASNAAGDSPWAYLNFTDSLTYTNPLDNNQSATLDAGYNLFDDDVTSLNRYQVKYVIESGNLVAKNTDGSTATNPELYFYESQHNSSRTTAAPSATQLNILNPDGISLNNYETTSNVTLTLYNSVAVWDYWTLNKSYEADKNATKINQTVNYINAPNYIEGVKYFADITGNELAVQPSAATYDGSAYIRQVTLSPYNGYKNISLIANYKIIVIDNTDYSAYELTPADIGVNFTDPTGHSVDINGNYPAGSYYHLSDTVNADILVISKSIIKTTSFYLDSTKVNNCNFTQAFLTVKRVGKDEVLVDNQEWSMVKSFPELNLQETLGKGYFLITLVAKSSNVTTRTFAYSFLLQVKD